MNNSITRIILGSLLPSLYFGLFMMVLLVYDEGLTSVIIWGTRHIKDYLYFILIALFIPSVILSLSTEISNRKKYKYIYCYGLAAGCLIAVIYVLLVVLIFTPIEDIRERFIIKMCVVGGYGFILGLLTTIPLHYLYKREQKKKVLIKVTEGS